MIEPKTPPPPPPADPPVASHRAKRIARRLGELDGGALPYPAVRALAMVMDEEIERLRTELVGCRRCGGAGTITDRYGDPDECPGCGGSGERSGR